MAAKCSVCGESFNPRNPFARHRKEYACISCKQPVGSGCFRAGATLEGESGPVCNPCWEKPGGEYIPEFETVSEAIKGFMPVARRQIEIVREDIKGDIQDVRELAKQDIAEVRGQIKGDIHEITDDLKREINEVREDLIKDVHEVQQGILKDIHEIKDDLKGDIDGEVRRVDGLVRAWLEHAQGQIDRSIQKAFGYIWITMTSTLFLTFVGLIYFTLMKEDPSQQVNPVIVFRISLIVLVAMPALLWLFTAFRRAYRNRTLQAYMQEKRDGKPLLLRDYLFGFLYFRDPVQNIWGPVIFLGVFFAAIIFLLTHMNELF